MNQRLQKAFAQASQLSDEEQDFLAAQLLAELATDDELDQIIAGCGEQLQKLAGEALDEHRAGETEPFDHDRL